MTKSEKTVGSTTPVFCFVGVFFVFFRATNTHHKLTLHIFAEYLWIFSVQFQPTYSQIIQITWFCGKAEILCITPPGSTFHFPLSLTKSTEMKPQAMNESFEPFLVSNAVPTKHILPHTALLCSVFTARVHSIWGDKSFVNICTSSPTDGWHESRHRAKKWSSEKEKKKKTQYFPKWSEPIQPRADINIEHYISCITDSPCWVLNAATGRRDSINESIWRSGMHHPLISY